uniref:Uncharacterized protein n=1 Tax=Sphaerodactylus townsendi TaxID=933632 RepID=A0ACB8GED2_9SAUR
MVQQTFLVFFSLQAGSPGCYNISPCFPLCPLQNHWVPRRGDLGPKTIDQIHQEAEMEERQEHIQVQQLMSRQDKRREPPGPSSSALSDSN